MNSLALFLVLFSLVFVSGQQISNSTICVDTFTAFAGPTTHLVDPNDGSGKLFVLYLDGRLVAANKTNGNLDANPLLVLSVRQGAESGAYSMILHPQFTTNRRAFFFYSCKNEDESCFAHCEDDDWCNGGTCLDKKCASSTADPLFIDPLDEYLIPLSGSPVFVRRVTTVPFPEFVQGGGLYIAGSTLFLGTGDGSSLNDTHLNSQNLNRTAGKILAFDIDVLNENPLAGRNFSLPSNNPFVNLTKFPEIYALGLRQPYKILSEAGNVGISEVGENLFEEVNQLSRGANYGWPTYEGTSLYRTEVPITLNGSILTPPEVPISHQLYPYPHPIALMLGGIYNGADSCLQGKFLLGDFGGFALTVNLNNDALTPVTYKCASSPSKPCNLTEVSFFDISKDSNGEFYFSTAPGGIFKTVPLERCNLQCANPTTNTNSNTNTNTNTNRNVAVSTRFNSGSEIGVVSSLFLFSFALFATIF